MLADLILMWNPLHWWTRAEWGFGEKSPLIYEDNQEGVCTRSWSFYSKVPWPLVYSGRVCHCQCHRQLLPTTSSGMHSVSEKLIRLPPDEKKSVAFSRQILVKWVWRQSTPNGLGPGEKSNFSCEMTHFKWGISLVGTWMQLPSGETTKFQLTSTKYRQKIIRSISDSLILVTAWTWKACWYRLQTLNWPPFTLPENEG